MSKAETQVIPKETSERVERIKGYHAECLKAFGDQMGFAYLCGAELLLLKESTKHGEFGELKEQCFPDMPQRTVSRYLTFAEALQGKFATVANLKVERLQLTNGELPEKEKETILKAVHQVADGKTLTQLYRDLGVIREKKPQQHTPPKELSPDEKLEAELSQAEALVDGLAGEILLVMEGGALGKVKPASRKVLLDAAVRLTKALRGMKKKGTK
jgi:hypothetical protein